MSSDKANSGEAGAWMPLLLDGMRATEGKRAALVQGLRMAMRVGRLTAGTRLPASRVLAAELGIARITVEAAYAQLESEGYLLRQVGRGSFVSDAAGGFPAAVKTGPRAATLTATLSQRGAHTVAGGACNDPLLPRAFAAGSPDLRVFPHAVWRSLVQQSLRREGEALMRYGDPQGYLPLREALARYLQHSRGLRCDAGQIVVLTSSQHALQLCAHLLLDVGDAVALEDPVYRGARTAFASAGAQIQCVAVDDEGLRVMDLPTAPPRPKLIYTTPSHQYPTGPCLSLARRLALLRYAAQHQSWILEDDYDSEYHYDGPPLPALQGLDADARVIYVGTFSKVLFPGLRLAYMVLPPALVAPFVTARSVGDGHSASFMQAVTARFLEQGHFEKHLRYTRKLYHARRDHLCELLQRHCRWLSMPQISAGGLQQCVRLPDPDEARWTRAARGQQIDTPSLSALYAGAHHEAGWVLGFSALDHGELSDAVARLVRVQGLLKTSD